MARADKERGSADLRLREGASLGCGEKPLAPKLTGLGHGTPPLSASVSCKALLPADYADPTTNLVLG